MSNEFSLRIVKPVKILESMILESNVLEDDYAAYAAGTTYELTDRVIYLHKIYESVQASNLGKTPDANPTWWTYVSDTNKYKCFDNSNSTQTTRASSIQYKLKPGVSVPSISVLNVEGATSLRIEVNDATYGELFDETTDLSAIQSSSDWWDWSFGARSAPTLAINLSIPGTPTAEITITLTGTADLAVGVILLGQAVAYGLGVKYGAKVGLQDYSRKENNVWGDTILAQRNYAKRASFSMELERPEADAFYNLLTKLRAVPCLWIGSEGYECTIIFGFFKEFEILIPYPNHCDCSLELEGLT